MGAVVVSERTNFSIFNGSIVVRSSHFNRVFSLSDTGGVVTNTEFLDHRFTVVSGDLGFRFDPSVVHVNGLESVGVEDVLFSVEGEVDPEPGFGVFSLELEGEGLDGLVFFGVSVGEVRVSGESELLLGGVFNQ